MNKLEIKYRAEGEITPYINNTRTHSPEQIEKIKASINEFGMCTPIGLHKGTIIYGHARFIALKQLGNTEFPTVDLSHLSEAQKKAYIIADNQLALDAGWDEELLKIEIESLEEMDFDIDLLGFDDEFLDGLGEMDELDGDVADNKEPVDLYSKYVVPPFSVLNSRDGRWQDRKKYWLNTGIDSKKGRGKDLIGYQEYLKIDDKNTSIFDPVLCEILYRWFSPSGCLVLDPFAGGSVRGIMAAMCNREYIGNDISSAQVMQNREQAADVCNEIVPSWTVGDSVDIVKIVGDIKPDFILSCPPYADLEVYSDDHSDLSNMDYPCFIKSYSLIISECYKLLNDNSFACWVVGEVRDKYGNYLNFVGDTIKAFTNAGFSYYNEMILVTPVGTVAMVANRYMESSRKIGKTHQNVLVFLKGDAKKAKIKCGSITEYMGEYEDDREQD